jgi:hypothetical protein
MSLVGSVFQIWAVDKMEAILPLIHSKLASLSENGLKLLD